MVVKVDKLSDIKMNDQYLEDWYTPSKKKS
jgi:hypothetical protein